MTQNKRILFICGSINQTTQLHQVARCLPEHKCLFTPYYGDRIETAFAQLGWAEGTITGYTHRDRCIQYLQDNRLTVDLYGMGQGYDLVVSCSDLIVQRNIRSYPIVLIQEGMTDPEGFAFHLIKRMGFLPRWLASTSMTGTSNLYDRFCVASQGYRDVFIRKGARPDRLVVTGIPNFDNCAALRHNDFPDRDYVLVCTTDMRETFRFESRRRFIQWAVRVAKNRPLIFKLHPNEKADRAIREIEKYAPGARVFSHGNVGHLVANCAALVTQYSSVTYLGLALNKEVYSYLDVGQLRELLPIQNGGQSARNIAAVCRQVLEQHHHRVPSRPRQRSALQLGVSA